MAYNPRGYDSIYGFDSLDFFHNFFPEMMYDAEAFSDPTLRWMRDRISTLVPTPYLRQRSLYEMYSMTQRREWLVQWRIRNGYIPTPVPELTPVLPTIASNNVSTMQHTVVPNQSTIQTAPTAWSTIQHTVVSNQSTIIGPHDRVEGDIIIPGTPLTGATGAAGATGAVGATGATGATGARPRRVVRRITPEVPRATTVAGRERAGSGGSGAVPGAGGAGAGRPGPGRPGSGVPVVQRQDPLMSLLLEALLQTEINPQNRLLTFLNNRTILNANPDISGAWHPIPEINPQNQLNNRTVWNINPDISGAWHDVPVIPNNDMIEQGSHLLHSNDISNDSICSVCQHHSEPDTEESTWRVLYCGHSFHQACVDRWFTSHVACPVCRADIRDAPEEEAEEAEEGEGENSG